MNPILLAAAFGFAKGVVLSHFFGESREASFAKGVLLGPISEEIQFRYLPFAAARAMGHTMLPGVTALPFGLAHASARAPLSWNAFRVTDATLGGLLYESAFRRFGLLGAIAAHAAHNLAVTLPGPNRG